MSVAQVKKRFGEFESYLRRDKEGLRRLKLLKDDVNVLRTSLAAAEKHREEAIVVRNEWRERADSAELEVAELRVLVQSLQQKNDSLVRQVDELTRENTTESEEMHQAERELNSVTIKRIMKRLKQRLPVCPESVEGSHKNGTMTYVREDISGGWSYEDLWILGASVAMLAAFDGYVRIKAKHRFRDMNAADGDADLTLARHVIQWYKKSIDPASNEELLNRKAAAPFGGVRWGDKPRDAEMTAAFLDGGSD